MFNVHEFTYLERIQRLQESESISVECQENVIQWLDNIYYRRLDDANIQTIARVILEENPQLSGPQTKRYQFNSDPKNELLKIVFNRAFKKASDEGMLQPFITQAETASSTRIAYSKWSKIIQIKLPKIAGDVIGSRSFTTVAMFVAEMFTATMLVVGYVQAHQFTNRVIIPFALKHAPAQAIRAYSLVGMIYRLYCICLLGIVGCWGLKLAARKWDIMPLNRFFTNVDFAALLMCLPKPLSLAGYGIIEVVKNMLFTFARCEKISIYLKDLSASVELHQGVYVRNKACEVWMKMMNNRPELAAAA